MHNTILYTERAARRSRQRDASHRRIRAPSKSTKRLTLQSLREFAVAWSTAGYAFAFRPRSFSLPFRLSLFIPSLLTTLENATSPRTHRPAGNGYEYRQLFFTLVEHISTTVGVERESTDASAQFRIRRGVAQSLVHFDWNSTTSGERMRDCQRTGERVLKGLRSGEVGRFLRRWHCMRWSLYVDLEIDSDLSLFQLMSIILRKWKEIFHN